MAEIIDITDLNENASSNFGGGAEFLMNHKSYSENQGNTNIDLSDLDNLEKELNDLKDDNDYRGKSSGGGSVSFRDMDDSSVHLNIHEDNDVPLDLGSATSNLNSGPSWDNYGPYNDIPNSGGYSNNAPPSSSGPGTATYMSQDEKAKLQHRMIRKLEDLEKKSNGKYQMPKKFTMESPFNEVKNEYDAITEDGAKKASIKFQAQCMKMLVNGLEFLNNKFDPFDVNLDGWGDQVDENLEDYDDIFGELYDKYQSRGSIAPELKLLFQLGGSAFMVNLSNKIFKTATPGMDDIFRQNPDLMRSFQNAAINTMGQTNPGIGNFMSGVVGGQRPGPPPPVPTQGQYAEPPPPNRGGNNPRPDLAAARGVQARDPMYSMSGAGAGRDRERMPPGPRNIPPAEQPNVNRAMNLALGGEPAQRSERRPPRAEMRGPSDLGDLLSGIKTKTISAPIAMPRQQQATVEIDDISQISNDSISISASATPSKSGKKPRKPRKPKSDKNTVSLDL